MGDTLALLGQANQLLAEAKDMRDVLRIKAIADGQRKVLQVAQAGTDAVNSAMNVSFRAQEVATQMLAEMRERGELTDQGRPGKTSEILTLSDLGLDRRQAHEFAKVAAAAQDREDYLAECREDRRLASAHGLLQFSARRHKRPAPPRPDPPEGRYRCLVIDPPWPMPKIERNERPMQGDELPYETMALDEIAELPVPNLAHEDGCHVYLWVTHKFLPAGLDLFENWGVKYQCIMTWRKNVGITPFSWMYDTEHVLFGRVGNLQLDQLGLRLSFDASVTRHSAKPDIFYERVRLASPGPRLEMFARKEADGFSVWGNEVGRLAG